MSGDSATLYPAAILQHSRAPKNQGPLDDATHEARLDNPLCGDRVAVQLRIEGTLIQEARFTGKGCAISLASASMLTEAVSGLAVEEATELAARLLTLASGREDVSDLGPLEPLRGVRAFPGRRRCATLPWEALQGALKTRCA